MDNDQNQEEQKVQADNNSIAVGGISIGGDVSGNITIGNTGYTSEEVSVLITQIKSTFQPKPFDGRCPYKGLDVFEEEDAELFFGREKLVDDLVSRVKDSRTVFVTGPSGSGKSSLVRAGLIHGLKQGAINNSERWLYATLKPGRDPIGELGRVASSLAGSTNAEDEIRAKAMTDAAIFARWCEIAVKEGRDKRVVLFIDQFEEVFTQISSQEERAAFLNLLTHAATVENGRVIILFSMRSDFVSNCATYPQANALLNQQFVQIGAMQPEELVSAIAQPALRVGLRIDPDLIAQIINEMKGEPGALPLMQFALKDLFDSQHEKSGVIALTLTDYLQRGGIHKALERHADDSFSKLSKNEQELARSIFSGLIEIGRGTQDTRRTALFDELIPANTQAEDVATIVQKLANARLITTDESAGKDIVTISHEKLIDAWPWLKKLVNENRDVIVLQNEIAEDAKEWDERKRDDSYLYSGGRLANVQEQVEVKKLVLNEKSNHFIQRGLLKQKKEQRTRILGVSGLIGLIIAGILSFSYITTTNANTNAEKDHVFAITQQALADEAQANADRAEDLSKVALARQIMTLARSLGPTSTRQPIAVLLAIQSMKISPTGDGAELLTNENYSVKPFLRMELDGTVNIVKFSPDNKYLASGGCDKIDGDGSCIEGFVRIWSLATGTEETRITHNGQISSIDFSPDGKYLVSADGKTILVSEVETGNELFHISNSGEVLSALFSPDGNYIASGNADMTARVWDMKTQQEVAQINHKGPVFTVAFAPDSNSILSGSGDKTAILWDLKNNEQSSQINLGAAVTSSTFSQTGRYIALGGADGAILVWSPAGEVLRMEHEELISSVAFSPDETYLVSGSYDGTARVTNIIPGTEESRMTHEDVVTSVTISPDGNYVISGSSDFTARVWDARTGQEISRITKTNIVTTTDFSPNGSFVAAGGNDGYIHIWKTPRSTEGFQDQIEHSSLVRYSRSGNYVVSVDNLQNLSLWNRKTGEKIYHTTGSYEYSLEFALDEKRLLLGTPTSYRVIELATGETIFEGYRVEVGEVVFTQDLTYALMTRCDEYDLSRTCIKESKWIWDIASGKEIANIPLPDPDQLTSFILSPKGKYLLTSIENGAQLWETNTGIQIPPTFNLKQSTPLDFSPDEKYLVIRFCDKPIELNTACPDNSIDKLFEISTGREISLITPDEPIYFESADAFSPNGDYVVLRSMDYKAVYVKKTQTGHDAVTATSKSMINFVFSPDSQYIALTDCGIYTDTCEISTIRILKTQDGSEVFSVSRDGVVDDFAISPDNKYLATAVCKEAYYCFQSIVTVWDISNEREISRIITDVPFYNITFSSNGSYIFSANYDYLLAYQPEDIISDACSRITRDLTDIEWKQYLGDLGDQTAICSDIPESKLHASSPVILSRGNIVSPVLDAVFRYSLININIASLVELGSLPGIGPTTAQKIIEFREANGPFSSIEDLLLVPGIGLITYESVKDLITVE